MSDHALIPVYLALSAQVPNIYQNDEIPCAVSHMFYHLLCSFNPANELFSPEPLKRLGTSFVKADGSFSGQSFISWLEAYSAVNQITNITPEALAQLSLDLGLIILHSSESHHSDPQLFLPTRSYTLHFLQKPFSINTARLYHGHPKPPHMLSERLQALLQEFIDAGFQQDGHYDLDSFYQSPLFYQRWIWQLCELQSADFSSLDSTAGLVLLINLYNILWLASAAIGKPADVRRRASIYIADQSFTMEELLRVLRALHRKDDPRYAKLPRSVSFDPRTLHYTLLRARGPPLRVWAPATFEFQMKQAAMEFPEMGIEPPSQEESSGERFPRKISNVFKRERLSNLRARLLMRGRIAPSSDSTMPVRSHRPMSGSHQSDVERERTFQEEIQIIALAEKIPRLELMAFKSAPFSQIHQVLGQAMQISPSHPKDVNGNGT